MNRPASAVFINSPIYQQPAWGSNHPLAISRISAMVDLCKMLGWLPDNDLRLASAASNKTLLCFHSPDYLAAFQSAQPDRSGAWRRRL